MTPQPVSVVFGGTRIGNRSQFMPGSDLDTFFATLASYNVRNIDTAQAYGSSEAIIGRVQAGTKFTIDTKWSPPSYTELSVPWATKDQITRSAQESIERLGVDQVDIFYLHRPDPLTPVAETLSAVDVVHKRGLFRRFGLSGFPSVEVQAIHRLCSEMGYPLPVVYQGSYNPFNRHKEATFFPILRELNMSFYAYGTSAGGFLCKTSDQAEELANNDEAVVSATCRPYIKNPHALAALAQWNDVASSAEISPAELAYRWVAYHSALKQDQGDALIIGSSTPQQLAESLKGIQNGPLSHDISERVDRIWAAFGSYF